MSVLRMLSCTLRLTAVTGGITSTCVTKPSSGRYTSTVRGRVRLGFGLKQGGKGKGYRQQFPSSSISHASLDVGAEFDFKPPPPASPPPPALPPLQFEEGPEVDPEDWNLFNE